MRNLAIVVIVITAIGSFYLRKYLLTTSAGATTKSNVEIEIRSDSTDRLTLGYTAPGEKCPLRWIVNQNKSSNRWTLQLSIDDNNECVSFSRQLPLHRSILARVFKEHRSDQLNLVLIPMLSSVDPSRGWNLKILQAADKSPLWQDYAKNYPNHESQRSSNAILIELIVNDDLLKPIKDLFSEFDIDLMLDGVEKVFSEKPENLNFVKNKSEIKSPHSLAYDAGIFWFKKK